MTGCVRHQGASRARHLYLLLHEEALDELAVLLPQPGVMHADAKLQRMPKVRVLRGT